MICDRSFLQAHCTRNRAPYSAASDKLCRSCSCPVQGKSTLRRLIVVSPLFLGAGEPAGSGISWLAEVITALLQQAEELGLSEAKLQPRRQSEGLAVPEGVAWRKCFATFLDLIMRHLKTLCEVCRLAQEVSPAGHYHTSCLRQQV